MNPIYEEEFRNTDELAEEVVTEHERFEINSLESLTWAFEKLNGFNASLQEIKSIADAGRERFNRWEKKESQPIVDNINYFSHLIGEYHAKVLAENPKKKTISTPYGKSKSTSSSVQPEKPDKENEATLLEFVKANKNELVKTVEEVQWGEFKKTLKVVEIEGVQKVIDENGQDVPGVTIKSANTTYKVEITD